MASAEDLLIASFEAVKVPELLVTGELDADEYVSQAKDAFIDDIVQSLRLKERAAPMLLNITHGMIIPPSGSPAFSDDFYMRLQLSGVQTLASIERNRDSWNYMVVQFAKFNLGKTAIRHILQYSEFSEEA